MKILISGISGKMGQLLKNDVIHSDFFEFAGGFDFIKDVDQSIQFDCLIDFSNISQVNDVIKYAVEKQKPLVLATTGLTDDHLVFIEEQSKFIPIFQSNNFSYGIQVLLKAISSILPMTDDFDIELIEKHHRYKVDAPSGTAMTILEEIKSHREDSEIIDHYQEKREKNQIGVHAVRGGTIVGEHELMFATEDEMITIKHEALSRQVFSKGALRAAKFIKDKKSGLYHMPDLV